MFLATEDLCSLCTNTACYHLAGGIKFADDVVITFQFVFLKASNAADQDEQTIAVLGKASKQY